MSTNDISKIISKKIAIALIHGVGQRKEEFAEVLISKISKRFYNFLRRNGDNASDVLVFRQILWSDELNQLENIIFSRIQAQNRLSLNRIRKFIVNYAGDAIAYQPTSKYNDTYKKIHLQIATEFHELAERAGESSPLCIIAHSLGTIIVCNYMYDLQMMFNFNPRINRMDIYEMARNTPLERGDSFAAFYTMGSPLALWSLKYSDFGVPLLFPTPKLGKLWPRLNSEWINFYFKSDILAYPIKHLNVEYKKSVTEDIQISRGGVFTFWNPLSHMDYWSNSMVAERISTNLSKIWTRIKVGNS